MKSLVLNREQSRDLDRRAVAEFGFTGLVLMENAGRGCVDVMERLGIAGPIVILCGKGNNAGDGFVIARHLSIRGFECHVVMLTDPAELQGDAAANYQIVTKLKLPIVRSLDDLASVKPDWIVDAMLGTGATGEPRPPFGAAIDWMNDQPAKKLAVDVPSGLDCDTGQAAAHTVRADHTCTFAAMKIGFTLPAAKPYVGEVHVCDIGVPASVFRDVSPATI